jgi:hypothetical protein
LSHDGAAEAVGVEVAMLDNRASFGLSSNIDKRRKAARRKLFSTICMGVSPICWRPRFCAATTRPIRSCRAKRS